MKFLSVIATAVLVAASVPSTVDAVFWRGDAQMPCEQTQQPVTPCPGASGGYGYGMMSSVSDTMRRWFSSSEQQTTTDKVSDSTAYQSRN